MFNLEKFKNGHPAKTQSGSVARYVAVLQDNVPAKLVVDVDGVMENYYSDGTFHGPENPSDEDLELMEYPLSAAEHNAVYDGLSYDPTDDDDDDE